MAFKFNRQVNEIPSIMLMRGIAASMVCYFHFAHENPRLLAKDNWMRLSSSWGWAGVQIFFIISGFIIPYSMFKKNYAFEDLWPFLKKRIIRIEPPYIASILLVLLLMVIGSQLPFYRGNPLNISWGNVLGHIGYLNVFTGQKWLQDVYWTLAVEFQFYLLISGGYFFIVSKNLTSRLLFFSVFLTLILLKFTGNGFIFIHIPFFMLGIVLFQYYCSIIKSTEFFLLLTVNFCTLLYFHGLILSILAITTLLLIMFVKRVPAFFRFLGMISYSLYLTHIPVGGRLINISEHYIKNEYLKEAVVPVVFGFSLLFAFCFYTFIEKKFKVLAGSIAYRRKDKFVVVR